MIAPDTNVLARYLLTDDRKQAKIATALLEGREQFTARPTVILELAWVLESCDCARVDIVNGLRLLFGLPNFKPKEPEALWFALAWYEQGMDFGDALHIALSAKDEGFVTFDRPLVKLATKMGHVPEVLSPAASGS